MTFIVDLLFAVLFAVAWPLFDYFVIWQAFLRRTKADPAQARVWIWGVTICEQWALVVAGIALWLSNDRSWESLGFSMPSGWRLCGSIGLILLLVCHFARTAAKVARSSRAQASARKQFGKLVAILPHTQFELGWFVAVSLTAGFCEEFLFRGYFICAFRNWLGWWGAAAISIPFFAILHAYQGKNGVINTGVVGLILTLVVAIFGSLVPAIALHAIVDIGSGIIAWLALRAQSENRYLPGTDEPS